MHRENTLVALTLVPFKPCLGHTRPHHLVTFIIVTNSQLFQSRLCPRQDRVHSRERAAYSISLEFRDLFPRRHGDLASQSPPTDCTSAVPYGLARDDTAGQESH